MSPHSPRKLLCYALAPVMAAAVASSLPSLRAAEAEGEKAPSFSDKTSEAIGKLAPLINAKNWDGALALLNGLVPTVGPDSYDLAVIDNTLGGIYWQGKEDPKSAIAPWENMIKIVEAHPNYYPKSEVTTHYQYLANIYLQLATDTKLKDEEQKKAYFNKALEDYRQFLAGTKKPQSDDLLRYASLLYYRAVSDQAHIDHDMLKQAIAAANNGLYSDIHPKAQLYQVLQSAYALDNNLVMAAEYTELLLKQNPTSKDMWPQLWSFYYNLAVDNEKNSEKYRVYLARSINTIERAQALGYMKTQRDNLNLSNMYQTAQQFGKATELLHAGLLSGGIEDTKVNWKNLALYYKLIGDQFGAINVLKEAEKRHSDTGDFDQQISEIYQEMENTKEAYNYIKAAVEKGNLSQHPGFAWYQLAYLAYEQQNYPEALEACTKGLKYPDAVKECTNLRDGVQKLIDQEKATKDALKAQQQAAASQ